MTSYFLVETSSEKRPAGAARATDTAQMERMASSTDTRPDLGARGLTMACSITNTARSNCLKFLSAVSNLSHLKLLK